MSETCSSEHISRIKQRCREEKCEGREIKTKGEGTLWWCKASRLTDFICFGSFLYCTVLSVHQRLGGKDQTPYTLILLSLSLASRDKCLEGKQWKWNTFSPDYRQTILLQKYHWTIFSIQVYHYSKTEIFSNVVHQVLISRHVFIKRTVHHIA